MTAQPHQPKPTNIANTTFIDYVPTDSDLRVSEETLRVKVYEDLKTNYTKNGHPALTADEVYFIINRQSVKDYILSLRS